MKVANAQRLRQRTIRAPERTRPSGLILSPSLSSKMAMQGVAVFEHHKEKKALEQYRQELEHWQSLHDSYVEMLQLAEGTGGVDSEEIMLAKDEHIVAKVANASLVEDRRGRGTYTGGSQGVSFPIGKMGGRTVRYRVGATRGHYVQGEAVPTAIDTGNVFVTNQRVIFQGAKQTRECLFTKLIGIEHDDASGSTVLSVSNRQKATTIHYGPKLAGWFDFRVDLALAQFKGAVPDLIMKLKVDLSSIEQSKPVQPTFS